MIGYIVNNSISHPPHRAGGSRQSTARRFSFISSKLLWMRIFQFSSFFALSALTVFGDNEYDLLFKIKELRLKSNAHGKFVTQLLENEIKLEPIEKPELLPSQKAPPEDPFFEPIQLPVIDLPAVPEKTGMPKEETSGRTPSSGVVDNKLPTQSESADPPTSQESYSNEEERPTYEELYASKHPQRRVGYYFGPFFGPVLANDSAVKPSGVTAHYDSKGGIVGGFRLGNDFGSARIEAEYAFLTHAIESSSLGSGDANIHNLKSRLILEKSVGNRADIRGGIGLGVAFINKDLDGKEYDGVGFSYDFLLGWSYRVMNNWSINLDYRHYLTAAHKNYDRLQGHIIELSAGFDL